MGVTAWFRSLARCENDGSIVEYVGVSGLALLVTGWIIVTISAQRFTIGGAMANIHARQIVSFESGLGGTANTNAQLYPHVTPRNSAGYQYSAIGRLGTGVFVMGLALAKERMDLVS